MVVAGLPVDGSDPMTMEKPREHKSAVVMHHMMLKWGDHPCHGLSVDLKTPKGNLVSELHHPFLSINARWMVAPDVPTQETEQEVCCQHQCCDSMVILDCMLALPVSLTKMG